VFSQQSDERLSGTEIEMNHLAALALFLLASLAHAESCPTGQAVTAVTLMCSAVGTTTPPVTCTPPKVLQNGVCADPPVTPPTCTPPQVLQGGVCVTPSPAVEGPWNGTCPGFNRTLVLTMNFANPQRLFTQSYGGFGGNDIIVVTFTTGSTSTPNNNLSRIAAAEYGTGPTTREAVLSPRPCDFSAQPFGGASVSGTSVTVPFAVGAGENYGFYPKLLTNTTYYYNIKNTAGSGCSLVSCDMAVDLMNTTPKVGALATVKPSTAAIDAAMKARVTAATAKAAKAKALAK